MIPVSGDQRLPCTSRPYARHSPSGCWRVDAFWALADAADRRAERDLSFEFDQPSFLTLGAAYEKRARLSGGAYQPVLRRIDDFLDEPLAKALPERERRAAKVLAIDDQVGRIVEKLKQRGLTSPYLKAFVVARVNYTRFVKSPTVDFDEAFDKITASARKFNVEKIRQDDVAKAAGGPPDEE